MNHISDLSQKKKKIDLIMSPGAPFDHVTMIALGPGDGRSRLSMNWSFLPVEAVLGHMVGPFADVAPHLFLGFLVGILVLVFEIILVRF